MTVSERLKKLRESMEREGVDAWIVPTDDYHASEYVSDYFRDREWLTGFTGSAGTALVTQDRAYLWTDGRYFIQAEMELSDSGIGLMKIGEEGVLSLTDYVQQNLKEGQILGFDGRCVTAGRGDRLTKGLKTKGVSCRASKAEEPWNLVREIREDHPDVLCHPVREMDVSIAGESRGEKIHRLREEMAKERCDYHILTTLDDIAWLLNLRGDDIEYTPVFFSYLIVEPEHILLFAGENAFTPDIRASLARDGVEIRDYNEVYRVAGAIPAKSRVLLDSARVNYTLWTILGGTFRVDRRNPTMMMKAVKNPVEMEHMRQAHLKDGIAMCRFIYWLKKQMAEYDPDHPVTEMGAEKKLLALRDEMEGFLYPSFATIAGYGPHGAIIHYEADEKSDAVLKPEGFLLVDSGGQYLDGTTDITRTIACGKLTQEEKELYTRVLRGNLNLGNARFHYGCSGVSLDYLARQPLWEIGLDYKHGTGHGVGFQLMVHEGPNNFSYKMQQARPLSCVMEEGMVTSNEPGVYIEGKFGVRCENLLLCVKDQKNEYGQFMRFETLTLVPWDLEAVDEKLLGEREKAILNEYHQMVWKKISPYLEGEELGWLREATRAI